MTVLKKQDMYSLSCTTDLPPVCPKGTGSTAFPHKPLPKQIWRGSGTLSLLSGVTKFRKHQVYVCVCVFSWKCRQAAVQNASLLMWFRVCGGVCVLLCGFESGNEVCAGLCMCDCRGWSLFSWFALLWCTCECCAALLCLESLDSSWKPNLKTHTIDTNDRPESSAETFVQQCTVKYFYHHAIWILKIAQTWCVILYCAYWPFRFLNGFWIQCQKIN